MKKELYYTNVYDYFVLKKKVDVKQAENIYKKLRVGNTFKTTTENRMRIINSNLKEIIKKNFIHKVDMCDVGISSGQTTHELICDLSDEIVNSIYGFDKQIFIKLYIIKDFIFIYSSKEELLMVEYKKHSLRARYFYILKKIDKAILKIFNFFRIKEIEENVLIDKLLKIKNFKYEEQDIFNIDDKYVNKFDIVKVSNLLNLGYFSERDLSLAVSNLLKMLKEDSLFVVNRTHENGENHGSFFLFKNKKLQCIEDIGNGTEIKKIVMNFKKL